MDNEKRKEELGNLVYPLIGDRVKKADAMGALFRGAVGGDDMDLAQALRFFLPPPRRYVRDDFEWVKLALPNRKKEDRKAIHHVWAAGGRLWATDGHRFHSFPVSGKDGKVFSDEGSELEGMPQPPDIVQLYEKAMEAAEDTPAEIRLTGTDKYLTYHSESGLRLLVRVMDNWFNLDYILQATGGNLFVKVLNPCDFAGRHVAMILNVGGNRTAGVMPVLKEAQE